MMLKRELEEALAPEILPGVANPLVALVKRGCGAWRGARTSRRGRRSDASKKSGCGRPRSGGKQILAAAVV
jgi:hypothetical protein